MVIEIYLLNYFISQVKFFLAEMDILVIRTFKMLT